MLGWLTLNTVLPLSPVLLVWGGGRLIPSKRRTVFEIIKEGQLFFYCTGIIIVTLNDILTKNITVPNELNIFLYALITIFSVLFGLVALNKEDVNVQTTGWTSLACVAFSTTVVVYIRYSGGSP